MATMSPAYGGVRIADPLTLFLLPSSSRDKNVIQERRNRTSTVIFGRNANALSSRGRLLTRGSLQERLKPVCSISSKGEPSLLNPASPRTLPRQREASTRARAQTGRSSGLSYPAQAEKPEWWWRVLAGAPYLIACQISDAGYFIQPLLRQHEVMEELVFFIPGVGRKWFSLFPMVYCMLGFSHVVKNKRWPHFLRYHLIMGMLLETALQIVCIASNWAPLIHYGGALGVYYWAVVGFVYLGILIDGIRCALGGNYLKIPFVGEAALIHTHYNVGGFQRPF